MPFNQILMIIDKWKQFYYNTEKHNHTYEDVWSEDKGTACQVVAEVK